MISAPEEIAPDPVRERLLKAALDSFLSDEYHKVTTRLIAEKADTNIYSPIGANVGDGIKMAMWQGANVQDAPHPPMIHVLLGMGCVALALIGAVSFFGWRALNRT